MVCFFSVIAWQSYWGKILESEAIPKDLFLPWLSNSVFMDLCCLGSCHPGYISPLTTKSLLKWGIDSSCRRGLQLGLAARWQGALKDQVLCWPHRVGGQQKSAQPALRLVSVELLVQGWACSSWQLPTASSALALAAVYPHARSLALVSSNPARAEAIGSKAAAMLCRLSPYCLFREWWGSLALYSPRVDHCEGISNRLS